MVSVIVGQEDPAEVLGVDEGPEGFQELLSHHRHARVNEDRLACLDKVRVDEYFAYTRDR